VVKSGDVSDTKGTIYNNMLNFMWDNTDNILISMWDNTTNYTFNSMWDSTL